MDIHVHLRLTVPGRPGVQGIITERSEFVGLVGVSQVRWLDNLGRLQTALFTDSELVLANIPQEPDSAASILQRVRPKGRDRKRKPAKKSKRK